MPIIDVNNIQTNIDTRKKLKTSISFKEGEVFSARVVEKLKDNKVVLRLPDGWQFEGEIEEGINLLDEGILKFQVIGSEGGKIKIRIMPQGLGEDFKDNTSLKALIDAFGLEDGDLPLLKELLKYNIPLDKENIEKAKALLEFKNALGHDDNFQQEFIEKYIGAKGIILKEQGDFIDSTLKKFFSEIKGLKDEDIFLLMETLDNIDGETIASFKNLFKEDKGLYNTIKSLDEKIKTLGDNNKEVQSSKGESSHSDIAISDREIIDVLKGNGRKEEMKKEMSSLIREIGNIENKELKNILHKIDNGLMKNNNEAVDTLKKFLADSKDSNLLLEGLKEKLIPKEENLVKDLIKVIERFDKDSKENVSNDKVLSHTEKEEIVKKVLSAQSKEEITVILKGLSKEHKEEIKLEVTKILEKNLSDGTSIKEELKNKGEEIKNLLKAIIESGEKAIPKEIMKDFKLYNKFSGDYYYMDIPMNVENKEYGFRIIIKDKRKEGKALDSKNIKMLVTVDTKNMDKIDAYISVIDKNMNITLKANEKWVNILDKSKRLLGESLENLCYNLFIYVEPKVEEVSISSCRNFFKEGNKFGIDVRI